MAIRLREEIVFEQSGDLGYLYDNHRDMVFAASGPGMVILSCIDKGNASLGTLVIEIASRFDINKETAEHDVFGYLETLKDRKVLME